mmetsp:Transcript_9016/g.24380  ORF Transcript_9016/g.24380 Transcript_9016/m.24380 type:complete len:85 (-) Transcript_9016:287-541(-)
MPLSVHLLRVHCPHASLSSSSSCIMMIYPSLRPLPQPQTTPKAVERIARHNPSFVIAIVLRGIIPFFPSCLALVEHLEVIPTPP